ncbi:salicylate synthase [Fusibacter sp. JL298sf-3]
MKHVSHFLKSTLPTEGRREVIKWSQKTEHLHEIGAELCASGGFDSYVLYENGGEIALGLGCCVAVDVYADRIELKGGTGETTVPVKALTADLESIFKAFPNDDWRVFGTANFALSYHTHGVVEHGEPQRLMHLRLPLAEVRLSPHQAAVAAYNPQTFHRLKALIEAYRPYDAAFYEGLNRVGAVDLNGDNAESYKEKVAQAVGEIHRDVYQKVILSRKLCLDKRLDMPKSYLLGRRHNTPARAYLASIDGLEVLGYSPETVAEVDAERWTYTFPLAGTRSMGTDAAEMNALRAELVRDPKEIAEHAVSVKLAFEELEGVCTPDSVSVVRFMDVLERGTVQHLASRLKGAIAPAKNQWDAFTALFPAVTASGIPKRSCLEAIAALETDPRELYSGSVLTYDANGVLDAALVLRSAYQNETTSWIRAGAGIVALSDPERELEETKEKLSCVSQYLVAK